MQRRGPANDPKPWFYAGLFSLATAEEGRRFLAGHEFTRAAIPSLAEALGSDFTLAHLGGATWALIERIRAQRFEERAGAAGAEHELPGRREDVRARSQAFPPRGAGA